MRDIREDWRASQQRHAEYGELGFPSRHAVSRIIDVLSSALFPIRLGPSEVKAETEDEFVSTSLQSALPLLAAQARMELAYNQMASGAVIAIEEEVTRIISGLSDRLPEIRRLLDTDREAAYEGDPPRAASMKCCSAIHA